MVESSNDPDDSPKASERPLFAHPPWMLGIVLVSAVWAIIAGLSDPIWLLLGLPCILVLVLYIYVRIATRIRRER
jgi:predicted signal transduction protein with EAL and GGDEF domain